MIKLIASDLDGTLMPEGTQDLSPRILQLIPRLAQKGIHFVVASGREYENERFLFEPVKDDISYIAANGSVCIHEGQSIFRAVIEPNLLQRILRELKQHPEFQPFLSGDEGCYIEPDNTDFMSAFAGAMPIHVVEDLTDVKVPIRKVAIFTGTASAQAARNYLTHLQKLFADEIRVVASGNEWIDFVAPGADKGTALKHLLQHLDIRPEECLAFGDQYNDVEMLQYAGISYAMTTAAPGVADYADYVTDSPEDVLEELLKNLE